MRFSWSEDPVFCFSSDVDWASEEVIKYSHNLISGNELKLTYFNTHPSSFIADLANKEIACQLIHPNFMPDSSQGNSFEEVINYCKNLVPKADGFRAHRYFEVNDIMDKFAVRGFKFFSHNCTRCEKFLTPYYHRSGLINLHIFF